MAIISAMIFVTKYSLPTIDFATRCSTRYSDFLLQPYSNPTRSKKNLLVCAWWWDMCYICFIYFLYLMSVNCSAEMKRIMTREDLSTPLAHGDSTIVGVFVCLPLLASSRDAPSFHVGWLKTEGGNNSTHRCALSGHICRGGTFCTAELSRPRICILTPHSTVGTWHSPAAVLLSNILRSWPNGLAEVWG